MDMNITSAAVLSQSNALRVASLAVPTTVPTTTPPSQTKSIGASDSAAAGTAKSAASGDSFAALLAAAAATATPASGPSFNVAPVLLTDAKASAAARPTTRQFMDKTGLDASTANEILTGVVRPGTDVRNWQAIMASDDPVQTAREATAAMFDRADPTRKPATASGAGSVLARSGRFVLLGAPGNPSARNAEKATIGIVDASGKLLRSAGNTAQSIAHTAWLYGLDTGALANIQFSAARTSPKLGEAVAKAMDAQPASFLNTSDYLAGLQQGT